MGLFNKLFSARARKEDGPFPTRNLKFKFEPIASNGDKFAKLFVDSVKSLDNMELDYSVASIKLVDDFLQSVRDEGLKVNDFAETIFAAGCYVGQVMVVNAGGTWVNASEPEFKDIFDGLPFVLRLGNGWVANILDKAYKRFYNGPEDDLVLFYEVLVSHEKSEN